MQFARAGSSLFSYAPAFNLFGCANTFLFETLCFKNKVHGVFVLVVLINSELHNNLSISQEFFISDEQRFRQNFGGAFNVKEPGHGGFFIAAGDFNKRMQQLFFFGGKQQSVPHHNFSVTGYVASAKPVYCTPQWRIGCVVCNQLSC